MAKKATGANPYQSSTSALFYHYHCHYNQKRINVNNPFFKEQVFKRLADALTPPPAPYSIPHPHN
mgnify:FL=1